jgi:hypothetical protein
MAQLAKEAQVIVQQQAQQQAQGQMIAQGASLVNISTAPPKNDLTTTTATGADTKIFGAGENV